MKQSGNVNGNDRFYFAGEVKFSSCEEGWLVISVHSGNWIVIRTELQKRILLMKKYATSKWTIIFAMY